MAAGAIDPETALPLLIAGAVTVTIAVGGLFVREAVGPRARRYKRRLDAVRGRHVATAASNGRTQAVSLARAESKTIGLDNIARRWLPRREALERRLARTGRHVSIGQYALAAVVIALLWTAAMKFAFGFNLMASLLEGVSLGITLPHMIVGRMGRKRIAAFLAQFPEAIDLMVRALRSGLPITEAIISAGDEMTDPVGWEFRQVQSAMQLGRELETVLWEVAKRVDAPEFRFFIIALSVQRETGGNLAETLSNLGDVLRRRRQMKAKIRAMSSEARASALILGALPFVMAAIMSLTSPEYMSKLWSDVRGLVLCGIGASLLAVGTFIMAKLSKFEI